METLNLNVNLENLTAEERDNLMKLVEKSQEKKSKVWKPESGEKYFTLTGRGEVIDLYWFSGSEDIDRFEIGNVFPTREVAEEEVTCRKMLTKWKRLSIESGEDENPWNNINGHWTVCYNYYAKEIDSSAVFQNCKYEEVYFSTKDSLLTAIKELGEDNVKRYILGVRD